jgi:hypothetical protein
MEKQDSGAASYIYETIILPVLMFECQTWSLAQKELRGMEEVTEG